MKIKKELTARQKTALANHKKKGTHTAKHMTIMREEMLKLANLVVVKRAKNEVIQLADPKNVYQVRHLRLSER